MDIQKVIEGLDKLFANRDSDKVEDYLSQNLEKALKEGDIGACITIINELIGFYRDTSQYDKAEKYCEKLLPFMEKAGLKDTFYYGTSSLNIANVYRASGRLEDSLAYYNQTYEIYEKTIEKNDFHYASLYNNLSLLYQEMGKFQDAADSLKKALDIVKEYPEAVVELAVTYTNLAASYVKAGDFEKAKEASKEGIDIFQNGLTEDYHYSAALSVAGDIAFANKEYELAAENYEKAMVALKKHVGMTHAYFRIISNLELSLEKAGKKNILSGLELSKEYYNTFAKKEFITFLDNYASSSKPEITFAKLGEGSDCFGFDDILSKDHDFGPGFCIFISKDDYQKFGNELNKIYSSLPESFYGFERPKMIENSPRHGLIIIEDFFKRILDLNDQELDYLMKNQDLPIDVWLRLDEWRLKTVTNGELYDGDDTLFATIYYKLKRGYPKFVYKRRIAQLIGELCQEGQYNYPRMMQRKQKYAAIYLLQLFEKHVILLLYLLNRVYAPHDKWLLYEAEKLEKGQNILEKVKKLMCMVPDVEVYKKRDTVDWIGKMNEEDQVMLLIDSITKEIIPLLQEEGLTKSSEKYLEQHIPYLLEE